MVKKEFDEKMYKEYACPNGSITCGLLKKLGKKDRCNKCKEDASIPRNTKDVDMIKKGLLLTYAVIKFEGKAIGRIERAYFPNITKAKRKYVEFHGLVEIEEDE